MNDSHLIRGLHASFIKELFSIAVFIPKFKKIWPSPHEMLKLVLEEHKLSTEHRKTLNALYNYFEKLSVAVNAVISCDFPKEIFFEDLSFFQKKVILDFSVSLLKFWRYNLIVEVVLKDFFKTHKEFSWKGYVSHDQLWLISTSLMAEVYSFYEHKNFHVFVDKNECNAAIKDLLRVYKPILKMFHHILGAWKHLGQKKVILKDYSKEFLDHYIDFPELSTEFLSFLYQELKEGLDYDILSADKDINHLKGEFRKIVESKKYDDYCSDPNLFIPTEVPLEDAHLFPQKV